MTLEKLKQATERLNTTGYEDVVIVDEEHIKMTWEELVEKAKELGAEVFDGGSIYFSHLEFYEDGRICCDPSCGDIEELAVCISSDRTPEQLLMIMEALK